MRSCGQRLFESRLLCTAVLALSLIACAAPRDDALDESATPGDRDATADGSRGFPSLLEGAFGSKTFALSLRIAGAGSELAVEGWEVDPQDGEDRTWTMTEHAVGATIERATVRHANEWFVVLRTSWGDLDVERWTLEHTMGAYFSTCPSAETGIGVAVITPDAAVSIEGEHYLMPSARRRPVVTRSTVVAGLTLEPVEMLVVDPDGRFLVLVLEHGESQRAVQVPLITSSAYWIGEVVPLWDFTPPSEVRSVTSIAMLEEASTARRALILGDVGSAVILWDAENDGVHESHEVLSSSEQYERYPLESWSRSW